VPLFFRIAVLVLFSGPSQAFYVSWDLNYREIGPKSGHEEITRQAMVEISPILKSQNLRGFDFPLTGPPPENPGWLGYFQMTPNFLISREPLPQIFPVAATPWTCLNFGTKIQQLIGSPTPVFMSFILLKIS